MMRGLLAVVVLLGASSALAQVLPTFRVRLPTEDVTTSFSFGPADCGGTKDLRVVYQRAVRQPCSNVTVFATDQASCPDKPSGTDVEVAANVLQLLQLQSQAVAQAVFTVDFTKLPTFSGTADGGAACGAAGAELTVRICAWVDEANDQFCSFNRTVGRANDFRLIYDNRPPNPPLLDGGWAGVSSGATIPFSVDSDVRTVRALVELSDGGVLDGGGIADFELPAGQTTGTYRVRPLVNGQEYSIRLVAVDAVGNESVPSQVVTVTPIDSKGLWGVWCDLRRGVDPDGGLADGGVDEEPPSEDTSSFCQPSSCSVGPGPLAALLGALVVTVSRRRRW